MLQGAKKDEEFRKEYDALVPDLRKPFGTFLHTPEDRIIVIASAITVVPVIELLKCFIRRGWFGLGRV